MDVARHLFQQAGVAGVLSACYYTLFGTVNDAYIIATVALWKRWRRGQGLVPPWLDSLCDRSLIFPAALALGLSYLTWRWTQYSKTTTSGEAAGPLKPLLFPCQTTHARLFPKKHSFKYSYLMVGIPVGWEGDSGGMIATGPPGIARRGWYQVHSADYLERGSGHLTLREKLDAYLTSQGIEPSQYPFAYLVTAAKLLGYHFNPVSFWYLYSEDKDMTAMILEVNNTFDERRMYFLSSDDPSTKAVDEALAEPGSEAKQPIKPSTAAIRRAWPKDFHVSPFNSRKGGYSLVAHDPFVPMLEGRGLLDSTINLLSSKSHAKLVARIFSDGEPIDPKSMSVWQKLRFLSSWWWVGFVTFPRIAKEAGMLFFKRQLHVWYRPEPLKESMGRRADETERRLEAIFRRYLEYLVSQSPAKLAVKYIPSGIDDTRPETMLSPAAEEGEHESQDVLEFKVLTPAFYTRFAYYAHDLEALFCELHDNCTIWISKPELLPKLIFKKPPPAFATRNLVDFGCFKLIQSLRQRPERIERPLTSAQTSSKAPDTHTKTDIRDFRISSMDAYVLEHESANERKTYRYLLLRLFLADRIALGSLELLGLEQLFLRVISAWSITP
ncbi:hypothetical protein BJ166DRAFT_199420 [Pestalotiopsis sp. NC0098]|nr:hypothetical protein BJ166DRAFT_199420 [Pestalotiopsis sp. NC0098]